jgi:nitroreductase
MTATKTRREPTALQAIYGRRAVRSYQPTPIDDSIIHALLDAAVQAPTAMHLEPWAFVVIQDRDQLKRFSDQAKSQLMAETARHQALLRVPGVSLTDDHAAQLLADPRFNIFYNAGTMIAICGRPMGTFVPADCWLAAENLMLAAYSLGLGSCCIGFAVPLLNTPEVKQELQVPSDVAVVAAIIVGVPAGPTPVVPRKTPEILHWSR